MGPASRPGGRLLVAQQVLVRVGPRFAQREGQMRPSPHEQVVIPGAR